MPFAAAASCSSRAASAPFSRRAASGGVCRRRQGHGFPYVRKLQQVDGRAEQAFPPSVVVFPQQKAQERLLFLQHGPVCVQSVPGRPGKIPLHIAVGHEGVIRLGPGVTGTGIFRALEAVFHAAVLPRAPLHRAGGTARAAAARAVLRLADVVHRAQPAVQAAQGKAGLGPRLFLHTKPPSIVEARRARITAYRPVPAGRAARSEMPIPACCRGIPA